MPKLAQIQRQFLSTLVRPLDGKNRMLRKWKGKSKVTEIEKMIRPNDRLSSWERMELYARQYWFRILESLYDDFPGLCAVLGEKRFDRLIRDYIAACPSRSFTLRDFGSRLESFLKRNPSYAGAKQKIALEMIRLEWAQINAFDAAENPRLTDEIMISDPAKLRIGIQPHVHLLAMEYPLDEFQAALVRSGIREELSNGMLDRKREPKRAKLVRHLRPRKTWLAVHRHQFRVYFRRLEPEEFQLLTLLRSGMTLSKAFDKVLDPKVKSPEEWQKSVSRWFQEWSALGWCSVWKRK